MTVSIVLNTEKKVLHLLCSTKALTIEYPVVSFVNRAFGVVIGSNLAVSAIGSMNFIIILLFVLYS